MWKSRDTFNYTQNSLTYHNKIASSAKSHETIKLYIYSWMSSSFTKLSRFVTHSHILHTLYIVGAIVITCDDSAQSNIAPTLRDSSNHKPHVLPIVTTFQCVNFARAADGLCVCVSCMRVSITLYTHIKPSSAKLKRNDSWYLDARARYFGSPISAIYIYWITRPDLAGWLMGLGGSALVGKWYFAWSKGAMTCAKNVCRKPFLVYMMAAPTSNTPICIYSQSFSLVIPCAKWRRRCCRNGGWLIGSIF